MLTAVQKLGYNVFKTALLVMGGSGALAGLYVSYRKQRTDEANHLRDQDKLFTERYTQAVAQLGNPAAAVRLGGVYALARIADDSQRDRATCLKVLCAYLRMPYDPDHSKADPAEREVRTTAQTALAERLRPDNAGFWPDAQINLTGAYLIDLDFRSISVRAFMAHGATFSGYASFTEATFSGYAGFYEATFSKNAWFDKAKFGGNAGFYEAKFGGYAWFTETTFSRDASFGQAKFGGWAWFNKAAFGGKAEFNGATFSETAWFDEATFSKDAVFEKTTFGESASFYEAMFGGNAGFAEATFHRDCPPMWPDRFAEPAGIVWVDPSAPDPGSGTDPDPPPGLAHPPSAP